MPVNSIAWICAWTKTAGFSSARPGLGVRDRAEPDVAALVGLPDRLEARRATGSSAAHASSVSVSSAYV